MPASQRALSRMRTTLLQALAEAGDVHPFTDFGFGVILAGRSVAQAEKMARVIQGAVDRRVAEHPHTTIVFAAGIAGLHRDEDPTTALCLAEHCLRIAESEAESSVVTSSDPRARQTRRRWDASSAPPKFSATG
jgi:GGDEF domain-containing protein